MHETCGLPRRLLSTMPRWCRPSHWLPHPQVWPQIHPHRASDKPRSPPRPEHRSRPCVSAHPTLSDQPHVIHPRWWGHPDTHCCDQQQHPPVPEAFSKASEARPRRSMCRVKCAVSMVCSGKHARMHVSARYPAWPYTGPLPRRTLADHHPAPPQAGRCRLLGGSGCIHRRPCMTMLINSAHGRSSSMITACTMRYCTQGRV